MATNRDIGEQRREDILSFFAGFVAEHGHSPTVREVAFGVGLRSPSPAHRQLERLVADGKMEKRVVTRGTTVYVLVES